jgi:hypothetical protein
MRLRVVGFAHRKQGFGNLEIAHQHVALDVQVIGDQRRKAIASR